MLDEVRRLFGNDEKFNATVSTICLNNFEDYSINYHHSTFECAKNSYSVTKSS